jgi:predicted nuclease of predicted toxin-antitoxin system
LSISPAGLRFLCDENIPRELGLVANEEGFDVTFVVDSACGDADEDVLARGHREARVIITEDTDFGKLVFAGMRRSHGVILIRISPWKRDVRRLRLRLLLRREAARLAGSFTVLGEKMTRIRPLEHGRTV